MWRYKNMQKNHQTIQDKLAGALIGNDGLGIA